MVASPTADLGVPGATLEWVPRLQSVTTIATPHFGTPLAAYFASRGGERGLHALSAAARTVLVSRVVSTANHVRIRELLKFLESIRNDDGVLAQLTPEAMDLFRAGVEDRPGVVYQCVAAMAPKRKGLGLFKTVLHPGRAAAAALFHTLHSITSRVDPAYPCGASEASKGHLRVLAEVFGSRPPLTANDGVVPVYSQLWGRLAWAGYADHLGIVGHFYRDRLQRSLDESRFEAMVESVVFGMMRPS
jgi:hypothetical protein